MASLRNVAIALLLLAVQSVDAFMLPARSISRSRPPTLLRSRVTPTAARRDGLEGLSLGPDSLVRERDACGVGFVAQPTKGANHDVVTKALIALGCMEHRGACAADGRSGDGSGIMTDLPWELFEKDIPAVKQARDDGRRVGVGMLFLSDSDEIESTSKSIVESVAEQGKLTVLGWRDVPTDPSVCGEAATKTLPRIRQIFLSPDSAEQEEALTDTAFERSLYMLRRRVRRDGDEQNLGPDELYVASMSARTITYKGMVAANALGPFYLDLQNPDFLTRFAIYHRRFSTNTVPRWPLAQPMRILGHNGEINTLLGNVNWMRARAGSMDACDISQMIADGTGPDDEAFKHCDLAFTQDLGPTVDVSRSDSANLDSILQLLTSSGIDPRQAVMTLVPEAFENGRLAAALPGSDASAQRESKDLNDFYEYHAPLQEAWDGPALLVFSDGLTLGAALDRNGLRPARYTKLHDGTVLLMSETGVVDIDESEVAAKGRLGPGQMLSVDLATGEFSTNADIKSQVASAQPWSKLLKETQVELTRLSAGSSNAIKPEAVTRNQMAFGWTLEDQQMMVADLALTATETTYSMGDDAPLAVLSSRPHVLFDYFRQRFAQVTNPAIDPLREGDVMSLRMWLGRRGHLLSNDSNTALISLKSPVLNDREMEVLRKGLVSSGDSGVAVNPVTVSTRFEASEGPEGLDRAVTRLCMKVVDLVKKQGHDVVVLSDLASIDGSLSSDGLSADEAYIPPLMATGAVHHALLRAGLRLDTTLVVETAQCWSTHHFACLIGYGASAVHPYLAHDTVRSWLRTPMIAKSMESGKMKAVVEEDALENYRKGIEKGLNKILSKMGISLLTSYQGAQIFEALGIGEDLLELSFKGTPARIGGMSTADVGRELFSFLGRAFPNSESAVKLIDEGFVKAKASREHHSNSPQLAKQLHTAVRHTDREVYDKWSQELQNRPVTAVRDLLKISPNDARPPVNLDEVEPVESIMRRFCTGGMSLGALSRECHETLAVAMNRIGGKSNSGEGGEDPVRFKPLPPGDTFNGPVPPLPEFDGLRVGSASKDPPTVEGLSKTLPHLRTGGLKDGDSATSAIKQIASGRFGVTPEYLAGADQLEIKVAQGAKPGEGGQLPGSKVSTYIAQVRGSKEGVTLISPPPHHDIYSIEDLAQLIYDLKAINPGAKVSVKLVAEPGIGTVAAGVAKANADVVQVSGHDGGTGASPLSSIKHAGSPWELGMAEVHRSLVSNSLRERVSVRVDGGIRTGYDVVVAALLGAEEFGFGTVAMVAAGCVMARVCHLNSCPVGITTQRPELRAKFPGVAEHVVNYFAFVAEEVRELLASLGLRSLDEAVGLGHELLQTSEEQRATKTSGLLTDFLTHMDDADKDKFSAPSVEAMPPAASNGPMLDDEVLQRSEVQEFFRTGGQNPIELSLDLTNTDRAFGARVAGALARDFGNAGPPAKLTLNMAGSAGQSFGAFNLPNTDLLLTGEANDYVGKGIHGGTIAIRPPTESTFDASQNVILGNTCLYGATGGKLFASGIAGERFAVRNSGAHTVVEGVGDHPCEYMTNGVVVVIGQTGRNIGAGMTGGIAYFLDEAEEDESSFFRRLNPGSVQAKRIDADGGKELLKNLLTEHVRMTGSQRAQELLDDWEASLGKFWLVFPASEAENPAVVDGTVLAGAQA